MSHGFEAGYHSFHPVFRNGGFFDQLRSFFCPFFIARLEGLVFFAEAFAKIGQRSNLVLQATELNVDVDIFAVHRGAWEWNFKDLTFGRKGGGASIEN